MNGMTSGMAGEAAQVAKSANSGLGMITRPTLRQRLEGERETLQERLRELDVILSAMAANPEAAALIDLVFKTVR